MGTFAYRSDWSCVFCCFSIHKHCYRYRRIFKSFRRILSHAFGIRLADVVYCQCWFRKCRRSYKHSEWKPISMSKTELEYNNLEKLSKEESIRMQMNDLKWQLSQKDILMDQKYKQQEKEKKKQKEEKNEIQKQKQELNSQKNEIAAYYHYQPVPIVVNLGGPMPPPRHQAPHRPLPNGGGGFGYYGAGGGGNDCAIVCFFVCLFMFIFCKFVWFLTVLNPIFICFVCALFFLM